MTQSRHPHPERFIVIEGIDGVGKSWTVDRLDHIVTEYEGQPPVLVQQPGGTRFSYELRRCLLQYHTRISPITAALAFSASRRDLTDRVIRPQLQQGRTVISDRWTPSTQVYQHECPADLLETLIVAAAGEMTHADLTILITRDPADAVAAKIHEYGEEGRDAAIERLDGLQKRYRQLLEGADPGRWVELPFSDRREAISRLEIIYKEMVSG